MIPRRRDMMGAMRRSSVMSALAAMGAEGEQPYAEARGVAGQSLSKQWRRVHARLNCHGVRATSSGSLVPKFLGS
jgi:hypothetical protein